MPRRGDGGDADGSWACWRRRSSRQATPAAASNTTAAPAAIQGRAHDSGCRVTDPCDLVLDGVDGHRVQPEIAKEIPTGLVVSARNGLSRGALVHLHQYFRELVDNGRS